MKTLLLLLFFGLFSLASYSQDTVQAKELSKKELRKLKKELEKKAEDGLFNEYGIDVNAPSIARAIRRYLGPHKLVNGNIILRSNDSMNTGTPYASWDVDGQVRQYPPYDINLMTIRSVKVLRRLSETNKYGFLGASGVIVIKTTATVKD